MVSALRFSSYKKEGSHFHLRGMNPLKKTKRKAGVIPAFRFFLLALSRGYVLYREAKNGRRNVRFG